MNQDSVDRTLAEWAENAPELDVSRRHVVWRLQVVAKYIHDAMSALPTLDDRLDRLSPSATRLLLHLIGTPAPHQASPTALSSRLLLTTPTLTSLIDRLEGYGYVERHPDPSDRRAILVRLTADGKRISQALQEEYTALEARILAPLDDAQRALLVELLRMLILSYESDGWRDAPED